MDTTNVTQFPELNALLAELVSRTRAALGPNFVATYLQGSFALGDGDAYSDVDFVTVVREDLDAAATAALNAMHADLHGRPTIWAQHLEGSYAPAGVLRRLEGAPTDPPGDERLPGWLDPTVAGGKARVYPFLFLDNGSRSLVRSEHDNALVVRWVLRESGIALAGPPAKDLVDPVDPEALRDEVREAMRSFGGVLLDGSYAIEALWLQGFTVLIFCRMLVALETATIPTKPAAVRWALAGGVPAEWHGLVVDAWEQRGRYARGHGAPARNETLRPEPARVAETLAFVRWAMERAGIR